MKTVFINIQIDDVKLSDIEALEKAIEEAVKEHKRRNVTISISDTFGPGLPEKQ